MEDPFDDLVKNDQGQPLRLFHGTSRPFDQFQLDNNKSIGIHLGCHAQADFFVRDNAETARIYPVFVRSKNLLPLDGCDFGWRYPHQTAFALFMYRFAKGAALKMSFAEHQELTGYPPSSSIEAKRRDTLIANDFNACFALNTKIAAYLENKGFDCVRYHNRWEPNDGVHRQAFFVLKPSQLISAITLKSLG